MAVLRVAHVWGDRLLEVRHFAGDGAFGPLTRSKGRIRIHDEAISVPARLPLGETTLVLEYVEEQPRLRAAASDEDWHFAKILGCLLVAFVALVASLIIDVQFGFADDDTGVTLSSAVLRKIIPASPPKKPRLDLEAARQKQLELKKQERQLAKQNRPAKPIDIKTAGILGLLLADPAGGEVFTPGLNPGIDKALDGLHGQGPVSDALGLGGPRDQGPGGGPGLGNGPGIFGIRRPVGDPSGRLRKKLDVGPCCAQTQVTDGLSKELVGKVIRLHFNAIKFCYERELQHKPELAGKVMILFTIDPTGSVVDANVAESSLDDANVEACMLAQVRHWKFPEPAGGGVVGVSHPWFFKPAGAED